MAASLRIAFFGGRQLKRLSSVPCRTDFVHRLFHQSVRHSEKWQLMSAVCLERHPVIGAEQTELEQRYDAMLQDMEFEKSLECDHELRHREDLIIAERRKQEDYEETEAEAVRVNALEEEDMWEAELHGFTPASRITEADNSGDLKSLDRCLEKKLILLVKQKLGSQTHWVLPQGPHQQGQSMRQSAERVLSDTCGHNTNASFLGNAPCGFLKYRYDSQTSDGAVGAKVFFYKAQTQNGSIEPSESDISDHVWIPKDKLLDYVTPSYHQYIDKFIMDL